MVADHLVHIAVQPEAPPPVFGATRRGYDREEVDHYVAAVEQELAELRWLHEALDVERATLSRERSAFEAERDAWRPSFAALGGRVEELVRSLEEEVAATRHRLSRQREQEQATAAERRRLLETQIAEQARAAELACHGELARARAQAAEIVTAARRTAVEVTAGAERSAAAVRRTSDELRAELAELRRRVLALTEPAARTGDGGGPVGTAGFEPATSRL